MYSRERYSARIGTLALEADRLLAAVPRDPEAPHYSEQSFLRKLIDAKRRPAPATYAQDPNGIWSLSRREWKEVLLLSRLTGKQLWVVQRRAAGWTFEEIGRCAGHSKQGAQNIFVQAARKVIAAVEGYPFAGLTEVYRQEIHRGRFVGDAGKLFR